MPSVSVVMAVRDGARFLRSAIDSVLAQTLDDLELIVVDDASTDGSRSIACGYADDRVRVIDGGGGGQAQALNRGLAVARADLVARLDADDVAHPRRFERQVAVLRERPSVALLGSRGRVIDAAGRDGGPLDRPCGDTAIRWYNLIDNPFIHSAAIFRKSVVRDELGGYDESFAWVEDWELWSRVMQRHAVDNLAERLVDYRAHVDSATAARRDPGDYRLVLRRVIETNVRVTLHETLADRELDLLAGFSVGLARNDVKAFLHLLFRLADVYRRRLGQTHVDRVLARQIDTLAYRTWPAGRRSALAAYGAALRHDPELARWLPWPRVLALLVGGRGGIKGLRAARRVMSLRARMS
jgi:glycosyltransferase involved in cell wall biosynthesis